MTAPPGAGPYPALAALAAVELPGQATPFAVVDLDVMERNIARMAEYFGERPAGPRPHFKQHKRWLRGATRYCSRVRYHC